MCNGLRTRPKRPMDTRASRNARASSPVPSASRIFHSSHFSFVFLAYRLPYLEQVRCAPRAGFSRACRSHVSCRDGEPASTEHGLLSCCAPLSSC